jgi:HAD superfamily hydrolase (TIGR01509 family)
MPQAIVFDFDGVIVDSEPVHFAALLEVARTFGHDFDFDAYLKHYVGFDDRDAFRAMIAQHEGRTDFVPGRALPPEIEARVVRLMADKARAFHRRASAGVPTIPGAAELIREAVAARFPIAIASGATTAEIDLILTGLGLRDAFPVVVSADDVHRSKPDPASYRLAVEKLAGQHVALALTPERCVAIEDTAAGVASAKAAGLLTLGLTTTGKAEMLHQARRVAPDLLGITLDTLNQWFD